MGYEMREREMGGCAQRMNEGNAVNANEIWRQ